MDLNEKAAAKIFNATLKEISKDFHRFVDEFAKLREAIEKNGYVGLPTVEMTEERGE